MKRFAQIFLGTTLVVAMAVRSDGSLPVRFEIDASQHRTISPYIYGTNQPNWQRQAGLVTLTRWGGSRASTYNWETNASNAGAEWRHQNDAYLATSDMPGEPVRRLVADAHAARASVIVSVPMLGYVAADKLGDGDVANTPDFLHRRFWESSPQKGRPLSLQPDLGERKVSQDEFVHWLETLFPESRHEAGRTIFYALDHAPDLWPSNQARVHPQKTRYEEIVRLGSAYAAAIKSAAPHALVFGPVSDGWRGCESLQDAPDAQHRDFVEFYLQQMRQAEQTSGRRLLDVLDIHWYPEALAGMVRVTEDDARPDVAVARMQRARSLWDADYVENSWITKDRTHGPIRLLPRLQEKIDKNYRRTRLAISEYYYGGGGDISGALAEADVLGIFGREGVFAAALGHLGRTDDRFIYAAFAMFRNYDGQGGAFGEVGLMAKTSDVEGTSVYASLDMQERVVLVALNKGSTPLMVEALLKHARPSRHAEVYQLTKARPQPVRTNDVLVSSSGRLYCELPAQSISTLVLMPDTPERGRSGL